LSTIANKLFLEVPSINNFMARSWKKIKEEVKQEADFKCSNPECPIAEEDLLEVHHINPQSEGGSNSKDNLVALCPSCHATFTKNGGAGRNRAYTWRQAQTKITSQYLIRAEQNPRHRKFVTENYQRIARGDNLRALENCHNIEKSHNVSFFKKHHLNSFSEDLFNKIDPKTVAKLSLIRANSLHKTDNENDALFFIRLCDKAIDEANQVDKNPIIYYQLDKLIFESCHRKSRIYRRIGRSCQAVFLHEALRESRNASEVASGSKYEKWWLIDYFNAEIDRLHISKDLDGLTSSIYEEACQLWNRIEESLSDKKNNVDVTNMKGKLSELISIHYFNKREFDKLVNLYEQAIYQMEKHNSKPKKDINKRGIVLRKINLAKYQAEIMKLCSTEVNKNAYYNTALNYLDCAIDYGTRDSRRRKIKLENTLVKEALETAYKLKLYLLQLQKI
jgi:5-methylcytosine-specific restriction endonuclease McrA